MFLSPEEGDMGLPQNSNRRNNTGSYKPEEQKAISYLFVIFNIPKHNKKKRSNPTPEIFLSAPAFIFVDPADPTWLGTTTSHLSATACGWQ